ncbi:MAG: hypothetical protein ACYC8T_32345, partial [Myxococcaceae bacterium]
MMALLVAALLAQAPAGGSELSPSELEEIEKALSADEAAKAATTPAPAAAAQSGGAAAAGRAVQSL